MWTVKCVGHVLCIGDLTKRSKKEFELIRKKGRKEERKKEGKEERKKPGLSLNLKGLQYKESTNHN